MSRRASRCRCGRADAEHGEEVLCALAPQLDTETELDAGVVTAHCVTTSGWNGALGVHAAQGGRGSGMAAGIQGMKKYGVTMVACPWLTIGCMFIYRTRITDIDSFKVGLLLKFYSIYSKLQESIYP
jgi:hypothetical protein